MKIVRKIKEFYEWYLNQPPIYDRYPYLSAVASTILSLLAIVISVIAMCIYKP